VAEGLFPKIDQKFLLRILQFQTEYSDWEGSVMVKVVYKPHLDMTQKKEKIYSMYGWMSSIEQDKMLRFKAIKFYIEDLERLVSSDPDIVFVSGTVTLTPTQSYSS
jgi:hypothetical protein